MSLHFIDLFCGAGFGARGAKSAGAEPVIAVDAWKLAIQTYKDNFPATFCESKRIEEFQAPEIKELKAKVLRKFGVSPDVLLTSPECTSHSIARGANPGCEISRSTVNHIIPWAKVFTPDWIIVENVKRMEQWDGHELLINDIKKLGYSVNPLFLNAADYRVPQKRKRLFLLCSKHGFVLKAADFQEFKVEEHLPARSVLEQDINRYKSTPLRKKGRAKATLERADRAVRQLGKGVDYLIAYYGSDYAGGWQSLDAPLRTVTTLDRFGLVTWRNGVEYLRMLQPSELKRAMGAGEHSLERGTRRDKVKLCGNGVCAPVMKVIFQKIEQLQTRVAKAS